MVNSMPKTNQKYQLTQEDKDWLDMPLDDIEKLANDLAGFNVLADYEVATASKLPSVLTVDNKATTASILAVDIGLNSIGAYSNSGATYSFNAPKDSSKWEYLRRMDTVYNYYASLFAATMPEILILEQPVGFKSANALKAHWIGFTIPYSLGRAMGYEVICYDIKKIKAWLNKTYGSQNKRLAQDLALRDGVITETTKNHEHIADAYVVYLYYLSQK